MVYTLLKYVVSTNTLACIQSVTQFDYGGTSLNGPYEMRTTSVEQTNQKAPIGF